MQQVPFCFINGRRWITNLQVPGVLCSLSTEELLTKIQEWGLDVTEAEAQRFRDNEVDGDTVDCGLTETMVAYLFQASFKKQVKFNQFVSRMKESSVTLTLQTVSPEDWQPSTSSTSISNENTLRLPASFEIPRFPKNLQLKLDNKEPCHKNPRDRHTIIRVPYEAVAQYTMYPTNSEYVQAVKTLVTKYPFLKDREGNGYGPCVQGEDLLSIDAHLKVLQCQYQKMQPDTMMVHNRMQQTFAWRQKEIADGMPVEDVLKKYPFLGMPTGLCNELGWIQPTTGNVSQRFREGLSCVAAKVIGLTRGKTPLYQLYLDARKEALTDDLPDLDTRAALLFLPYVFKEKLDLFVILGEVHPKTPYPTVQLLHEDWKPVFSRSAPNIVKLDGSEVCRSSCIFEGIISSFCLYFVFNLAYPKHLKNTLIFLQKYIVKIDEDEDRPLPITVTRQINLLY
ncbi:sterile alpha motif domain-containing protein 3-like isoform X2 [Simochromis diagramma]|uniref:sterile alpha motif domain-containing protein 3-like isoform X2 n=1 Tax=Simochromis diagramma TaxID=43689 RepID=UPI001A7EB921|nr:sterile alpha motif domain-containing protein 3-like isoform X2 [Simochromis diagramma]